MLLLDRRLLLVSGKGGVGKTSVAAVLALLGARGGRRVRLLGVGTSPPALPGIDAAAIDGRAALAEYLAGVLPGPVHRMLVRSSRYQRLSAGAPGLFDLMVLGKIADDARGGAWDLVVADLGATGHALQMLAMPAAAADAFGPGRVRREAARIQTELADPAHTGLVAVTTPEGLAVDEVCELVAGAARLPVAVGRLVVNRLHRCPRRPAEIPEAPPDAPALLAELLRRGHTQARRAALDARGLERLGDLADGALLLPELIGDEDDRQRLHHLAAAAASGAGA